MAEVGSAFVTLAPSAKGFGRATEKQIGGDLDTAGKNSGKRFGTALKVGALGVLGGAAALGGFLKGSLDEARDAQKVGALTNAVIKSTGGVANVTAKHVDKLATSISKKTGVDDEAIAAGQNMLLTFGNVRNEAGKGNKIFDKATVAASDMSAAFGGDAVSNSKMLGKALNDPTKGVSALTRVGVSFTQGQKDQIKTLQKSGNIVGAQKIILGELTKQTGGAAEATATAGDKFKVAFGNMQESVGTALLPLWDKMLVAATTFAIFLTNDIGPGIAALNGFLAPAIAGVQDFFATLTASSGGSAGIMAMVTDFATTAKSTLLPILKTAAGTFQNVLLPAVLGLASYLQENLLPIFSTLAGILVSNVVPIVAAFATFLYGTLYPAIIGIATAVASNLKPVFDQLFTTFQAKILPALERLLVKFRQWQPTIQKVILVVVQVIGFVLKLAAAILGKVLPVVIRFAGWLISKLVGALIATVSGIAKTIAFLGRVGSAFVTAGAFVSDFSQDVHNMILDVVKAIGRLPGKVKALGTKMLNAGKHIIGKMVDGLSAAGGVAGSIAEGVGEALKGIINGLISSLNHAIPNSLGKGKFSINIADNPIPKLAKGGILTRPTLNIAGEAGPEAVIPLARLSSMLDRERAAGADERGRGRGGVDVNIEQVLAHDYTDFMQQMDRRSRAASLSGVRI